MHLLAVALHTVHSKSIVLNDSLQILRWQQGSFPDRKTQTGRPATSDNVFDDFLEIYLSCHNRFDGSLTERGKRYSAARISGFEQRHGAHAQLGYPAGPAV